MRDLQVPKEATGPESLEILRVWSRSGDQIFVCRPDVWADPAAWGLLLVDIARQVAKGYCEKHGGSPLAVLSRIKSGLDAEWGNPTDSEAGAPL
jgi:hypothetical protein